LDRELYKFNFTGQDFQDLAKRLARLRGKFLMTLNDVPEVRSLFGRFHISEMIMSDSAQRMAGKQFRRH